VKESALGKYTPKLDRVRKNVKQRQESLGRRTSRPDAVERAAERQAREEEQRAKKDKKYAEFLARTKQTKLE